jgi:hypothetical protein
MKKKHRKQKKQKSKKERESPFICGDTMDLWIKFGKTFLPKPEPVPKAESLPPEKKQERPAFIRY